MANTSPQWLLDRQAVIETIVRLGRAFDGKDWAAVDHCLASELDTDYSSFRGTPPTRLKAVDFIRLRRDALEGLITQHLSFGHLVDVSRDGAVCNCDFVIHRWASDRNDPRFFHSYGCYTYGFWRSQERWQIVRIKQIVRHSVGNPELHSAYQQPKI